MNAIVAQPQITGAIASVFANTPAAANDSLSAGIEAGFGLIGIKGKSFSIRYKGEERILMRDDGDGPRNSIEVVLLSASGQISKIWYEQGYVEGSSAPPDCFSTNGIVPHPGSPKKQHANCASCPRNQWGSRVTPAGKNGKSCADSRRLAVVPLNDINNELFGGALLLRVPAASLDPLAQFGAKMASMGYPYYSIATRIAFDPQEAFPKLQFTAIRPLSEDEGKLVLINREQPQVARILAENTENLVAIAAPAPEQVFEQPPKTAAPSHVQPKPQLTVVPVQVAPAPAPVAAPAPAPTPTPASKPVAVGGFGPMTGTPPPVQAAPAVQMTTAPATPPIADAFSPGSDFEREMDARLEALLPPAA